MSGLMGTTSTAGRVVYVIDDDVSVRTAMGRLLRAVGWDVQAFSSAEDFLLAERDLEPGILLVDVHLGRMSGLELQATLRERGSSMPVIAMSGVDDAEMEIEASRLGAIAFYRKPVDVDGLLESIRVGLSEG